ncbi:excinuclease ABC subunit UvrC [Mycoplasma marinum]|nr:excinuclease ABC subunit UvrC [Mycoplasma marinum]
MINWNIENIPKSPGVYLYKNKYDKIIYIGKAKNLKNRINQYMKGSINSFKTHKMIEEANSFEFIITKNEKEAWILERNLIKEHSPYYNIQFIDDKRYPYIKVKLAKKLNISMVRHIAKDQAFYFGPLPTGTNSRELFKTLQREALYENGLPIKNTELLFWENKYKKIKKILSSNNDFFKKELETKMYSAAKNELFELAQEYKESLIALNLYEEKQVVELANNKNIDVFGIIKHEQFLFICMMFYRNGSLLSLDNHILEIMDDEKNTISQFIAQYYEKNLIPDEVVIKEEFSSEFNQKFRVLIPEKGSYKKMLEISEINAKNNKEEKLRKYKRSIELTMGAIEKLGKLLKMEKPKHILMVDNSNLANQNPVSAIISYRDGRKRKQEYKKYNLDIGTRKADVEYMRQSVTRYFSKEENPIPDLFIVDGGVAQVNEVKKIIHKLEIELKVIGLVKNKKHITKSLINLDGIEESIEEEDLLNFLRGMQAEVDRFAKMQYRSRGLKGTLLGSLETIKGVGPKAIEKLIGHFKTYANIYNASEEELQKIVSSKVAKAIRQNYKNK